MKVAYLLLLIVSIISSEILSDKEIDRTKLCHFWNKIEVSDEAVVFLKLNTQDSTYILHWFISGRNDTLNVFGKITSADKYDINNNLVVLPFGSNIKSNELKASDGRNIKTPIDQNPMFKYDLQHSTLSFYGEIYKSKEENHKNQLEYLLEEFNNWSGNYISIHDN